MSDTNLPKPYWCMTCGEFRTVRTDGTVPIRFGCESCGEVTRHRGTEPQG